MDSGSSGALGPRLMDKDPAAVAEERVGHFWNWAAAVFATTWSCDQKSSGICAIQSAKSSSFATHSLRSLWKNKAVLRGYPY